MEHLHWYEGQLALRKEKKPGTAALAAIAACFGAPTQPKTIVYAKGDSGATTHYFRPEDACVLSNRDAQPGAPVTQLGGTIMRTNGSRDLPPH